MDRAAEVREKLARVREHLARTGGGGALFGSTAGFAWITGGGRSHVSLSGDAGVGAVLVTPDNAYLLANNIELKRLQEEELPGVNFEPREYLWWSGGLAEEVARIVPPDALVADIPMQRARSLGAEEGMALRNPLLPSEIERYRLLGEDVAIILTHVALHCRPGLSEHQLAGMISGGLTDFGIEPLVVLTAVDERVRLRRHPLPTGARLERYALLVATARRGGLHVSASRAVHFGPIPDDLRERHEACARVDAAFLGATKPGVSLADVFAAGERAYEAAGFPDEWRHHHQGGPTGYGSRDLKVTPDTESRVMLDQAFAWNPTIAGTKSEDTVLVGENGLETLSRTPDLPELEIEVGGTTFIRSDILER